MSDPIEIAREFLVEALHVLENLDCGGKSAATCLKVNEIAYAVERSIRVLDNFQHWAWARRYEESR